jgi:hypothetical protein
MNQSGAESPYSKQGKMDPSVWQIGQSDFIDSDGSQGRRRHSTREPLLRPSDVWLMKKLEPRQLKGLKRRILDLIDEKKGK